MSEHKIVSVDRWSGPEWELVSQAGRKYYATKRAAAAVALSMSSASVDYAYAASQVKRGLWVVVRMRSGLFLTEEAGRTQASVDRALANTERAIKRWLKGRILPTTDNRKRFDVMLKGVANICIELPTLPEGVLDGRQRKRLETSRKWLEAIVRVDLAPERVEQVEKEMS
jgi:hypothetical protein